MDLSGAMAVVGIATMVLMLIAVLWGCSPLGGADVVSAIKTRESDDSSRRGRRRGAQPA